MTRQRNNDALHPNLPSLISFLDRLAEEARSSAPQRDGSYLAYRKAALQIADRATALLVGAALPERGLDDIRLLIATGVLHWIVSTRGNQGAVPQVSLKRLMANALWPLIIVRALPHGWMAQLTRITSPSVISLVRQIRHAYWGSDRAFAAIETYATQLEDELQELQHAVGIIELVNDLDDPQKGGAALIALLALCNTSDAAPSHEVQSPLWQLSKRATISLAAGLSVNAVYDLMKAEFVRLVTTDWQPTKIHGLIFGPLAGNVQLRTQLELIAPYTEWILWDYVDDPGPTEADLIAHAKRLNLKVALQPHFALNGLRSDGDQGKFDQLVRLVTGGHVGLLILNLSYLFSRDPEFGFVKTLKQRIPGVPVTVVTSNRDVIDSPGLVAAVDFVVLLFDPFSEGIELRNALPTLVSRYQEMIAVAGKKPVIVHYAGWPSAGDTHRLAVASPANASDFFRGFVSWAHTHQVPFFYKEAFDIPYAIDFARSGPRLWGLWDAYGNLKPGIEEVFRAMRRQDRQ